MKKICILLVMIVAGLSLVNCGGSGGDKKPKTLTANVENGKLVYEKACIACHMTGVAGAAALTDKPRWEEMAAKGMSVLHQSVINGVPNGNYGVMLPRGSCTDCSDQDLYDGIAYMMKQAGVTAK
ncbi:MAG TPA: c-type cytochrome [Bacteroidales bacterium]|nr:c-type cytochrome [Bacteroidales bacterium]